MFKVIRDFVKQPQFLILCDRSCGTFSTAVVPEGSANSEEAFQALWAGELQKAGWKITLSEQACPAHAKQDAEGKSMIVVPHMSAGALKN